MVLNMNCSQVSQRLEKYNKLAILACLGEYMHVSYYDKNDRDNIESRYVINKTNCQTFVLKAIIASKAPLAALLSFMISRTSKK